MTTKVNTPNLNATFLGTLVKINDTQTVNNKTFNSATLVAPALGTPISGDFSSGSFTFPLFYQDIKANAAFVAANSAGVYANAGFTTANTKFNSTGGTISGNVTVTGNLSATLLSGTLSTAAQPNITSVGALTSLEVGGTLLLQQSQENFVSLTGATGVVTHNFSLGGTFYHTSIAGNFTANITNLPNVAGRVTVIALLLVQGATPYICNGFNIAGAAQTIRWLGGAAPVGIGTRFETQLFTIFQTGVGTYIVTGLLNSFA